MACHIIRTLHTAHCKRGPEVCEQCREMNVARSCLLDICPPDAGLMQRRVIQVTVQGEPVWREFDVVQIFETEDEARRYAAQHGIDDVEI
ncbi:MAG: hypothetical protein JXB35_00215 [Anaerolineae bacterium]|nr:hypothetical protein [Anaerolineae bacterium]